MPTVLHCGLLSAFVEALCQTVLGWVMEMATGGMVALRISAVFEVAELG